MAQVRRAVRPPPAIRLDAEVRDVTQAVNSIQSSILGEFMGGVVVEHTFTGVAPEQIQHPLGRVPTGFLVLSKVASAGVPVVVARSFGARDVTMVTSSTPCTIRVLVY